jgi:hypothetical protein
MSKLYAIQAKAETIEVQVREKLSSKERFMSLNETDKDKIIDKWFDDECRWRGKASVESEIEQLIGKSL